MATRLDIGCGDQLQEGWIGIDPAVHDNPDVLPHQAWALPYKPGKVDQIRCSHALEHLPPNKILVTLQEWYRVLVRGGEVSLIVPDARSVLQHFMEHPYSPWAFAMIHGRCEYPLDRHLTAFDPDHLQGLVELAGFEVLNCYVAFSELHNQDSIFLEAYKP